MKSLHESGAIKSNGTNQTYRDGLLLVAKHLQQTYGKGAAIANLNIKQARDYLEMRKSQVSQKTLDRDRQAMQLVLQRNGQLRPGQTLSVTKSEIKTELKPRAYSNDEVSRLIDKADERLATSIAVAREAGLRVHELMTIRKLNPSDPKARPDERADRKEIAKTFEESPHKWTGRKDWERYVVTGKGGLTREVRLSPEVAAKLEALRCEEREVRDRTIIYHSQYDLVQGKDLTYQFGALSKEVLGYSSGAHGLRHAYAQERMDAYMNVGYSRDEALELTAVEMGHFRGEITEAYMR